MKTASGASVYAYDAVGNRLSRTSTITAIPSTSNTFDSNDRLGTDQYDSNGSTTGSDGKTYRYDFENRLIAVNEDTPNEIRIVYDGDGNRVAKTVGGVTTQYLVDTNNLTGYAQVVEELTAPSGQPSAVNRVYVYGNDLINQTQLIDSNWTTSYYGYDGHGSVLFLTDASGAITDTYTYDAFGNMISQTGTTPNNYLYCGEQFDPDLGFYFLRARYMNPSTGRFWTLDLYEGSRYNPVSLHKYLYSGCDPINNIDPSGRSIVDIIAVITVLIIVLVIAVPILDSPTRERHEVERGRGDCPHGRSPNLWEKSNICRAFPRICEPGENFLITAPQSQVYNCIAWSVGITSRWIWDEVDMRYGNRNGVVEVEDFDNFYANYGFHPTSNKNEAEIVLYATPAGPTHAARRHRCQYSSAVLFESKLGQLPRIIHFDEDLIGSAYGQPIKYYR